MKRLVHLIAGMAIGALMTTLAFAISSRVATAQDPVKLSPHYYKVLLENDQVRVFEYRLKPGEKEPMHSQSNNSMTKRRHPAIVQCRCNVILR